MKLSESAGEKPADPACIPAHAEAEKEISTTYAHITTISRDRALSVAGTLLYRCPTTAINVQDWVADNGMPNEGEVVRSVRGCIL